MELVIVCDKLKQATIGSQNFIHLFPKLSSLNSQIILQFIHPNYDMT